MNWIQYYNSSIVILERRLLNLFHDSKSIIEWTYISSFLGFRENRQRDYLFKLFSIRSTNKFLKSVLSRRVIYRIDLFTTRRGMSCRHIVSLIHDKVYLAIVEKGKKASRVFLIPTIDVLWAFASTGQAFLQSSHRPLVSILRFDDRLDSLCSI